MKHPSRSISYSLIKLSISIISFLLVLSCFMNVESSRIPGRHLFSPSSINAFKTAPADASPGQRGIENLSQEYSGPSHRGIGH
ncbi:hypothetical protein OIU77_025235 [Salix suchowensis]|uniref:Uncharacterized protein n=1 Tax=Salix suchowensis TaxID=1278906 RepID=A0ABQ9BVL8_9ROSI|nr:hypothetical protein OIU77_025235 [Salix suchowensis]